MFQIDGRPPQSWEIAAPYFDDRLEIRRSPIHGHGIFACGKITYGEFVIAWGGQIYTIEQARAGVAKDDSLAGFDEGLYLGQDKGDPDDLDKFLNHSCDPTLWMVNQNVLCARRDIYCGEEITADYAIWEIDTFWSLNTVCHCGSPKCRSQITGNDWKRYDLQERYAGHFLPCINRRIARLRASQVNKND